MSRAPGRSSPALPTRPGSSGFPSRLPPSSSPPPPMATSPSSASPANLSPCSDAGRWKKSWQLACTTTHTCSSAPSHVVSSFCLFPSRRSRRRRGGRSSTAFSFLLPWSASRCSQARSPMLEGLLDGSLTVRSAPSPSLSSRSPCARCRHAATSRLLAPVWLRAETEKLFLQELRMDGYSSRRSRRWMGGSRGAGTDASCGSFRQCEEGGR
mmetsp:Transcript_24165/g.54286  ORF Transcript_24165/g.54286 Transcript_24165/m.54286 type:complete len:211 (+) Transcript_24165:534-1166(+)